MRYRPEIDGLRAFAVLPVILFHTGIAWFKGGFVGVDVFFVISGYLITRLILEDQETGRFSIAAFYERRARRILPALFVVLLACFPFAWIWMTPDVLKSFFQSVVATILFASNILLWLTSGYFDTASELRPLLHTWSLAVEEQFYVVFPLLLIALAKASFRRRIQIFLGLALVSLLLAQFGSPSSAQNPLTGLPVALSPFYMSVTRAWELLAGAMLGTFHTNQEQRHDGRLAPAGFVAEFVSAAGLLSILLAVATFGEDLHYPGVVTLLPVCGSVLILHFASDRTLIGRLLSTRPVVFIGLISYSAYLWHQPLFAFARIRSFMPPPPSLMLGLAALALVLAVLTWRYIERPFRQRTVIRTRAGAFTAAAILSIIILSASLYGYLRGGFPERYHHAHLIDLQSKRQEAWTILVDNPTLAETWKSFPQDARLRILLVGDSHSKDLFNALYLSRERFGSDVAFRRLEFNETCFAKDMLHLPNDDMCNVTVRLLDKAVFQQADWILVSTRWTVESAEAFPALAKILRERGKKLAITSRTTEFYAGSPAIINREAVMQNKTSFTPDELATLFYAYRDPEIWPVNDALERVATTLSIPFLRKADFQCDEDQKRCAAIDDNLAPLYFDYGHYTVEGARFLGARIAERHWLDPILNPSQ